MIVIFAEKPDMGTKIAAALDKISLKNGNAVSFNDISKNDSAIKKQRHDDHCFKINYLGKDCVVTWGFGHMCELKQAYDYNPEYRNWRNIPLPFIPDRYELKLIDEGVKEQYNFVKSVFETAELIVCATDDDREGDLIFDNIYTYMGCKVPFKRALFNKQSEDEFKKAFDPRNLVDGPDRKYVIDAGRARAAGDFVVGANVTTAITCKIATKKTGILSAGRVQTATLKLIYDKEMAIRNFKPEDYFVIKGEFANEKCSYTGTHEIKKFKQKQLAQEVLDRLNKTDKKGIIKKLKSTESVKKKPDLYSLQTLQMEASKTFKMSLEKTLEIAQSLYDKGYTTYPRTDSCHLPEDMVEEMEKVLTMLSGTSEYGQYFNGITISLKKDKKYFDNSKIESHYAIVPTTKAAAGLSADEAKIYDLIARSVIIMLYPDAKMSKVEMETDVHGEIFKTSGSNVVEPGFYTVLGMPKDTFKINAAIGDVVDGNFSIEDKQTEPPKRYTEGTLLKAMITCGKDIEDDELKKLMSGSVDGKPKGLGRPSSQATIVKTLLDREYITKNKATIFITDKGILLIEVLPAEDLKSAEMTAKWEKRLDDIEKGRDTYSRFISDLENSVRVWVGEIDKIERPKIERVETDIACPKCGRNLIYFGKGYSCNTGQDDKTCDFVAWSHVSGKEIDQDTIRQLCTDRRTGLIKGFVSKNNKEFDAYIILTEDMKMALEFPERDESENATDFKCAVCGDPLYRFPKGYKCLKEESEGKSHFVIWNTICGVQIGDELVRQLLQEKKTELITGFKGKSGKSFSAHLILTEENAVAFEFPEKKEDDSNGEVTDKSFICPVCGRYMHRFFKGWKCATDKDDTSCPFIIWNKISGVDIDEKTAKLLCAEGSTDEISGFYSQAKKKSFSAKLIVNKETKRVEFSF